VELFDLRHNFVNGTLTKAAAVKGVNRTEVARVLASAPVLHRSGQSIALVFEDASIEFQPRERRQVPLLLDSPKPVGLRITNNLFPQAFRVVDHHCIGILQGFIGQKSDVITTHHDWDPTASKLARNLISPPCCVCLYSQGDQIRFMARGNLFQSFVEELEIDVLRSQPGQHREDQRLHCVVRSSACHAWSDESDLHVSSVSREAAEEYQRPNRRRSLANSGSLSNSAQLIGADSGEYIIFR